MILITITNKENIKTFKPKTNTFSPKIKNARKSGIKNTLKLVNTALNSPTESRKHTDFGTKMGLNRTK